MSHTLSRVFKVIGLKPSARFTDAWDTMSVFQTIVTLSLWYCRGVSRRLFFKKSHGIVLIGKGVTIRHSKYLSVGKNFVAESGCEISCLSGDGIVFGNNVTVGSFAIIRPTNNYGGPVGEGLKVGDNSNIGPFSYIGCSGLIEIGSNVMISPRVSIYAENHNFEDPDVPMKTQGVSRQRVKIEDDCWIASNSVILAGVTIGSGSVVAAGSVVTKDVAPFSIVAGNPARVIRTRK